MAFSSTPLSFSEDFCTQSYSADDIVTLAMSYIDPIQVRRKQNDIFSLKDKRNVTEIDFVVVRNWLGETRREKLLALEGVNL